MLNLCIVIITVLYVNVMCQDVVIANQVGSCEEAETSVAEKQKTEGICVEKES